MAIISIMAYAMVVQDGNAFTGLTSLSSSG